MATAATLSSHGTSALKNQNGSGGEGGEGICRGDVEDGVKAEAGERDESEIGAGGGLDGIGGKRVVAGSAREFALLPREQRHDEHGSHGDGDSEEARLGLNFTGQGRH